MTTTATATTTTTTLGRVQEHSDGFEHGFADGQCDRARDVAGRSESWQHGYAKGRESAERSQTVTTRFTHKESGSPVRCCSQMCATWLHEAVADAAEDGEPFPKVWAEPSCAMCRRTLGDEWFVLA